ncbi:hypothetical protein BDV95DRAFT_18220 [Massariosphaeria phaeospora]|uniref:WD40-repeat-containing domain protein n=1 Tax=Massariosphaeria phaeospora TaxID=100035 RepID=A0A7C8IFG0_9PLEO|nr:hypothetical protein BDV95DRAFT_18220 [Massariosphaeria phaeospora]
MSSQHQNLADVWQHLQGKDNIAHILREIIGQHAVESTLLKDDSRNTEESIRVVIWVKTIFDLQRCYLSGNATGVSECPPYVLSCLLPPELLFSTILYLINVKTRLFSSQTTLMTREFTRPRHILAQTILSGLRLLLLRKEALAPQEKRHLQTAINSAWQRDRLHGVERFIVSDLFAAILDSLNEESHDNPYSQEWSNARLPTYAAGLYPLDIKPEMFVTGLIHGTMEEDWIDAYWVLFDCLWAVECAVTQRHVDLRRQTGVLGSNQFGADTDETLELLFQTRTSLIISIFHVTAPMTPTPALLDSLAITLLDWSEDLDSFLSRQDSLLQQRASMRPTTSRSQSYRKSVGEMSPYFEAALKSFADWLANRKSGYEQFSVRRAGVTSNDMQEMVKEWMARISSAKVDTESEEPEGPSLPAYIVDCPKLHVIPRRFLEYKLRWIDKWAYESIQENSPIVNWKEGIQCPSCNPGEKIKCARLIEPFQHLATALENLHFDDYSLSQYSVGDSGSYDATSHSASDGSAGISLPSQSTMNVNVPTHVSRPSTAGDMQSGQPPRYTESPVSPITLGPMTLYSRSTGSSYSDYPVSPLNESLNIPIPSSIGSRLSVDLPIPVHTASIPESIPENTMTSTNSDVSSIRLNTPSTADSQWSAISPTKSKFSERTRLNAISFRKKPSLKGKEAFPLPKEPSFVFSASGHSLLLWAKGTNHLVRFDIPSNDASAIQGCKYEVAGIDVAAAGNQKCAIIAASGLSKRKLFVFDGINLTSEFETDLEFPGRLGEICIAVSRNDKYIATSLNDQIQIFSLEDGIKSMAFHHQIHVYELRGGISHRRTVTIGRTTSDESITTETPAKNESGWFGTQARALSSREAAEEQQRQTAIISRKLYFSPDSKRLVVATQLGDHCVYVDVWDCTREPVSTISEHSRSFKLPPWTLNDGDLTSVFYDSFRRSAIVTAFLGKEYPVLVPFPGYGQLQNETYSTKIVHAAQSPSGATFVTANAMTEIIQFEYTARGTLSPHKLKKSSAKMSNSVFKPGAIVLAMPLENCLQCFWIKDGKCMLRTTKLGSGETFRDFDIRPHYDRLMSLKNKAVIARAPSLLIPELDAGGGFGSSFG